MEETASAAAHATPDGPAERPSPPADGPPRRRLDDSTSQWTVAAGPDGSTGLISSAPPESRTARVYCQVARSPDGLWTLDHYQPVTDGDVVNEFAVSYREVLASLSLRMTGRVSSSPFVLVRCPQCRSDILTNRALGKRFVCRRCDGTVNRSGFDRDSII